MEQVIVKAIDYILLNLDKELTVDEIATHCHYSKHYFNRVFKHHVGESVYSFIKRLRVEKSAMQIALDKESTITEIGNKYGYSSSNYSTLFKQHFGNSPKRFKDKKLNSSIRKNDYGFYADISNYSYEYFKDNVEVVILNDFSVIFERYIGDYHNLASFWQEFLKKYSKYIDSSCHHYEITFDDPVITNPNKCITDVCTTYIERPSDALIKTVKGGRYLKYEFCGPNTKIYEAFQGFLSLYVSNSKYKPDYIERDIFTKYKSIDKSHNILTFDILVPIY